MSLSQSRTAHCRPGKGSGQPFPELLYESLKGRVGILELGQLVQHGVAVASDSLSEGALHLHEVHQVPVSVQRAAAQLPLDAVGVRVRLVLRSPVSADKPVSGSEATVQAKAVHGANVGAPAHSGKAVRP